MGIPPKNIPFLLTILVLKPMGPWDPPIFQNPRYFDIRFWANEDPARLALSV